MFVKHITVLTIVNHPSLLGTTFNKMLSCGAIRAWQLQIFWASTLQHNLVVGLCSCSFFLILFTSLTEFSTSAFLFQFLQPFSILYLILVFSASVALKPMTLCYLVSTFHLYTFHLFLIYSEQAILLVTLDSLFVPYLCFFWQQCSFSVPLSTLSGPFFQYYISFSVPCIVVRF